MEQTALNLIAIGVFTITLSSLLGPLLHLSPVIPAVATMGIMGLITLDTLGWQNKGLTLLLDSLSFGQHRQRIIHHEAGHFLAAYILGIPITGYTLSAWEAFKQGQSGLGGVIFETETFSQKVNNLQEMPLMVERVCTVLMAGIAAEMLVYGNVEGGKEDRQKIREALILLGVSDSLSSQKERWALLQAKNLIKQYQSAYEALVEAMKKRLSVDECCQIVQQHF